MNLAELRVEIRDITNTDENSFTDTDLDRKLNLEYKTVIGDIMASAGNVNNFVCQAYLDLENASLKVEEEVGYNGEYPFPEDCLAPLRIEVKYDETQRPMTVYDQSQNNYSEFVADDMDGMDHKVRFVRNSAFIRPLPKKFVANGYFIEYVALPSDLSADTDSPDFTALHQDVLILATADRYYLKHPEKYNSKIEKKYYEKRQQLLDFFNDRLEKKLNVNGKRENWN